MTPIVAPENRRNHTTEGQAAFNPGAAVHKPATHLEQLIFGRWLAAVARCGDAGCEIERLEKLRRAHEGARSQPRDLARACERWERAVGIVDGLAEAYELVVGERKT